MADYKLMAFGKIQEQSQLLEVTVVGCYNLEDKELVASECSCVFLEYGGSQKRTNTCVGGGKHPIFKEKVIFTLVQGVGELNIAVWTSQPLRNDGIIGFARLQLEHVLSNGYVDSTWTLQRRDGRQAGDIRLILQLPNHTRHNNCATPILTPAAPPNATQPALLFQLLPYDSLPPSPAVSQPIPPEDNVPYPCTMYPPNSSLHPPTRPIQPNLSLPSLWSQLLPYKSCTLAPDPTPYHCMTYPPNSAPATPFLYPPTQPMSCYSSTGPPAGYPPHPHHQSPPKPGPSSAIYPPSRH